MNIIHKKPMFFWLVKLFFPVADWNGGVILTYGKNVYCKFPLTNPLIAHEGTHVRQQTFPLWWWIRYIVNPKFRFKEELEAHRNEYRAIKGNEKDKRGWLGLIADRLSGPLYNNLVSKDEAKRLILLS